MSNFLFPKNKDNEFITHVFNLDDEDKNEFFYLSEILKSDLPVFVKEKLTGYFSKTKIESLDRPENLFFNYLIKIVNSGNLEHNFKLQYNILNYRVDCFIEYNDVFKNKCCYILEYDEHHHFQDKNKMKDSIRMDEIINNLKKSYKEITVFRINEKYHFECLKHLIPYFSRFDCHCLDLAIEKKYLKVESHEA